MPAGGGEVMQRKREEKEQVEGGLKEGGCGEQRGLKVTRQDLKPLEISIF